MRGSRGFPAARFAPAPSDRSPFDPVFSPPESVPGPRATQSLVAMLSSSFIWATRVRMGSREWVTRRESVPSLSQLGDSNDSQTWASLGF